MGQSNQERESLNRPYSRALEAQCEGESGKRGSSESGMRQRRVNTIPGRSVGLEPESKDRREGDVVPYLAPAGPVTKQGWRVSSSKVTAPSVNRYRGGRRKLGLLSLHLQGDGSLRDIGHRRRPGKTRRQHRFQRRRSVKRRKKGLFPVHDWRREGAV